jgi:hypothetical protein
MNAKVNAVLGVILFIIVAFYFIGNMGSTLTDSANTISQPNNCSLGVDQTGATQRYLGGNCLNSTGGTMTAALMYTYLPLTGLFSPTGLLMLIVMIGLLTALIFYVMKRLKK